MQIIELQLVGKSEASLLLRYKNKRHIHIEKKNYMYECFYSNSSSLDKSSLSVSSFFLLYVSPPSKCSVDD